MSIFHLNGFLLVCFVVATVPNVLVLGSPGVTSIESIGFLNPPTAKCLYNKSSKTLVAQCSDLKLKEIPFDWNADIQFGVVVICRQLLLLLLFPAPSTDPLVHAKQRRKDHDEEHRDARGDAYPNGSILGLHLLLYHCQALVEHLVRPIMVNARNSFFTGFYVLLKIHIL
ncbi:uncharacterized protein LOC114934691 isoform X1 [Nylanderia fulva]|uniref:uncharacterized protein LOC114934691 isoform X1 n=1 Tax=Nylanderia fulva TaxID=613905 RepID=UPI0010FBA26F|nr:uncharacterized protein LOC114934691 isoform X1 [Nylanderia fulva]